MIPRGLRIVFMGTSPFACPSLECLLGGKDAVVGVFTQPDRPQGRGQKVSISPVKALALQHNLPVFQPEKVNAGSALEVITGFSPDLIVVAAFGQILSLRVLTLPRLGCINVHASLLPSYRGAAPINWAIIRGERVTGVTTMNMDRGMDTGDILLQREVPIGLEETAGDLHERMAVVGAQTLLETIEKLKEGTLLPRSQNHRSATYAPPLKKEDGRVTWKNSSEAIHNQIRGMNPWPGAFTYLGDKMLKIYCSRPLAADTLLEPGTVLQAHDSGIQVSTGKGCLLLTEIQLEGRKRMAAAQFLRGHSLPAGTRLGG